MIIPNDVSFSTYSRIMADASKFWLRVFYNIGVYFGQRKEPTCKDNTRHKAPFTLLNSLEFKLSLRFNAKPMGTVNLLNNLKWRKGIGNI
jgi:hypothetical protein